MSLGKKFLDLVGFSEEKENQYDEYNYQEGYVDEEPYIDKNENSSRLTVFVVHLALKINITNQNIQICVLSCYSLFV